MKKHAIMELNFAPKEKEHDILNTIHKLDTFETPYYFSYFKKDA